MQLDIKVLDKRIGKEFSFPQYATTGSAALDLIAAIDNAISIDSGERQLIPSGIAIDLQNSAYAALILPRSGLGHKHGIILGNSVGLIDSDYQGEIKISIFNTSKTSYTISPGDRIAQLMIIPVQQVNLNMVDNFATDSARGEKGFGHTGKN